jgi:hypothetical protein
MAEDPIKEPPIYEQSPEDIRKGERLIKLHRDRIERGLIAPARRHNPQFDSSIIDELIIHCVSLPQMAWDGKQAWFADVQKMKKERDDLARITIDAPDVKKRLAFLNAEIAYQETFLGRGTKVGFAWSYAVRLIGPCVLRALQSADRAAGDKERKSYGRPGSLTLKLIRTLIEPVCRCAAEDVPTTESIRNVLLGKSKRR